MPRNPARMDEYRDFFMLLYFVVFQRRLSVTISPFGCAFTGGEARQSEPSPIFPKRRLSVYHFSSAENNNDIRSMVHRSNKSVVSWHILLELLENRSLRN